MEDKDSNATVAVVEREAPGGVKLKLTFLTPLKRPLTEEEEEHFNVAYGSIIEELVVYIAGATYVGVREETAMALMNLERHIVEAIKELSPVISGNEDENAIQVQVQAAEIQAAIDAYIG